MNTEELLQYALSSGMIDLSNIQKNIEMANRKTILEKHKYEIYQGSDGKYRTYIPTDNGRKLVKRKTKKELEDYLIEIYKPKEKEKKKKIQSFNVVYNEWRKFHDCEVSDNTISHYNTDFKRYFENDDFCNNVDIKEISEYEIKNFIIETTREKKLCQKATKTLFGYTRNTFRYAKKKKYISDDPFEFLEAKQFYKYCTPSKNSKKKKVITGEDAEKLFEQIEKTHNKKKDYIPVYAVELACLTGMRVGEIAALEWSDIDNDTICISKSEKRNRLTNEITIEGTKNQLIRYFPMTEEIKRLLNEVKKTEMEYGYMSEYIFSDKDGRVKASKISSCIKNKCRSADIQEYGIHAYRRTINSHMAKSGVPTTVRASLLGHSEEVNRDYYTFDISDMTEKRKIISSANEKMLQNG